LEWPSPNAALVVVRLGDATWNADELEPGTALPVYFDFYNGDGTRWLTWPVPSDDSELAQGSSPCTLTFGDVGPTSINWWAETEGLPSSAASTKDAVVLPCHTAPAGADVAAILQSQKTIAILRRDGTVETSIRFTGFTGMRGTATGLRQVATLDARNEFWVAGIANSRYGLRYLPNPTTNTTVRIHGSTLYTYETPLRYQVGSIDLRSALIHGNQLFVTSSFVAEPNKNMDSPATDTPWGGAVRINATGFLARGASLGANLLSGFTGRLNIWQFHFEDTKSLWTLEDVGSSYVKLGTLAQRRAENLLIASGKAPMLQAAQTAEDAIFRPLFQRTSLSSIFGNWKWVGAGWVEPTQANKVSIPDACYSMVGRDDAAGVWTIYTTGRKALYRINTATKVYSILASAPAGRLFRGVALPPNVSPSPAPTPSSQATTSRSPSSTDTPPVTRTRTSKPRLRR